MRSHIFRLLCLAGGVGSLFAACGGGDHEETHGVLALAIRLDEGSPAITAYAGDPEENPLWLPTGRYYVEALDKDDVTVSLGSIGIAAGESVGFPPSFADVGGVADPDRAASIGTLAAFVVDVELSKYTLLEIVSGGFERPLFDPAVAITGAGLEPLFTIYGDVADQKDTILDAFGGIQHRAEVSSGVSYVNHGWMPGLRESKDEDNLAEKAAFLISTMGRVIMAGEEDRGDVIAEQFLDLAESQNDFEARLADPYSVIASSDELRDKEKQWRKYAQELARRVSEADDEAGRKQAQAELAQDIRNDLQDWLKAHGAAVAAPQMDKVVDILVDDVFSSIVGPAGLEPAWIGGYVQALYDQWMAAGYDNWVAAKAATDLRTCLSEVVAAGSNRMEALSECPLSVYWPAGTPAATPTPSPTETPIPTPTPKADAGWIEGYVQGIADGWLAAGYGGIDVAVAADDLRQCLTDAMQGGADRNAAIGECPAWLFEPQGSPEPTEAPTPTPAPTLPPGVPVTATGAFDLGDPGNAVVTENTMSLTWNTSGGPIISGTGRWRMEVQHYCGTEWESWNGQFSGTFDPALNTFSGEYTVQWARLYFHREPDGSCVQDPTSGTSTNQWAATLSGSTVTGDAGYPFHLTAGGGGAAFLDQCAYCERSPVLLDSYALAAIPSASRTPLRVPVKLNSHTLIQSGGGNGPTKPGNRSA